MTHHLKSIDGYGQQLPGSDGSLVTMLHDPNTGSEVAVITRESMIEFAEARFFPSQLASGTLWRVLNNGAHYAFEDTNPELSKAEARSRQGLRVATLPELAEGAQGQPDKFYYLGSVSAQLLQELQQQPSVQQALTQE